MLSWKVFSNRAYKIAPLLDSVHAALATYSFPWELVLVDDGSRDGTDQALLTKASEYCCSLSLQISLSFPLLLAI
jgi:glycosyltransferase involved in cell wall biosynthesis